MNEIEKKLDYLLSLETKNPRISGYIFTLKMALIQDINYEKKLEYLKSLKVDNEYIDGQIDALEWLKEKVPTKRFRK